MTDPQTTHKTCPECGNTLPPNAPEGLCRACLLKRGLESNTIGYTAETSTRWTPPSVSELAAQFPELEILRLIGRGGMGAVYQARQKNLDRIVALKILPPEIGHDPAFAERFTREARAMARLNHPHIVMIHEFGQRAGLFYLLMEFVDGLNLRGLLDSGHVSPKEALAIVPQICEALQFAHEQGIVHRDIKPENILLSKTGNVKIADFGLAKLIHPTQDSALSGHAERSRSTQDSVAGTPQYMAPEQKSHPNEVDHRADIYSLGVVFYQMLTGELPPNPLTPPSQKVIIDVRLDQIVLRALQREPSLRYQQISEVKTQIETLATSATTVARNFETPKPAEQLTRPKIHMVAVRNGQRIIHWPGVFMVAFIIGSALAVGALIPELLLRAFAGYGIPNYQSYLMCLPIVLGIFLGFSIREQWKKPLDQLPRLDPPSQPPAPQPPTPRGFDYRSKSTLFGWPLIHIAGGLDPATMQPRSARGIFAFSNGKSVGVLALGSQAYGIFALGGIAVGVFSFGGLGLGLFTWAGFGIGLIFAFCGFGIAPFAFGGAVIALYGMGGWGWGLHVASAMHSDPVAEKLFRISLLDITQGPYLFLISFGFPVLYLIFYFSVLAIGRSLANRPQSLPSAPSKLKPWWKTWWASVAIALIIALVAHQFFIESFYINKDNAFDLPIGSRLLIWKFHPNFVAGDLLIYRDENENKLGRVVFPYDDYIAIARNNQPPTAIPRPLVYGKIISVYWRGTPSPVAVLPTTIAPPMPPTVTATTPPAPPSTNPAEAPWGVAVHGIQLRLRPAKSIWAINGILDFPSDPDAKLFMDGSPTLELDVRNIGSDHPLIGDKYFFFALEYDGKLYTYFAETDHMVGHLDPGKKLENIPFPLDANGGPALTRGKHTVRAVYSLDDQTKVYSNLATIELLADVSDTSTHPATAPATQPVADPLQATADAIRLAVKTYSDTHKLNFPFDDHPTITTLTQDKQKYLMITLSKKSLPGERANEAFDFFLHGKTASHDHEVVDAGGAGWRITLEQNNNGDWQVTRCERWASPPYQ